MALDNLGLLHQIRIVPSNVIYHHSINSHIVVRCNPALNWQGLPLKLWYDLPFPGAATTVEHHESDLFRPWHMCMPCIRMQEDFSLDRVRRKVVVVLNNNSSIRVCNNFSNESGFGHVDSWSFEVWNNFLNVKWFNFMQYILLHHHATRICPLSNGLIHFWAGLRVWCRSVQKSLGHVGASGEGPTLTMVNPSLSQWECH